MSTCQKISIYTLKYRTDTLINQFLVVKSSQLKSRSTYYLQAFSKHSWNEKFLLSQEVRLSSYFGPYCLLFRANRKSIFSPEPYNPELCKAIKTFFLKLQTAQSRELLSFGNKECESTQSLPDLKRQKSSWPSCKYKCRILFYIPAQFAVHPSITR